MRSLEQVDPAVLANGSRTLWLIIAAMAAAVVVSYRAAGLSVDISSNPALLGSFPILGGIVWVYRSLRPNQHLACAMETTTQLLLVLLLGILLTYAAIAAGYPYRDAELHGADQWIGFDRRSYLAFIKAHHWLSHSFTFAYLSLHIQTALIPLALVIAGQFTRFQHMVVALAIALSVTVAVSVFVPALAAFAYLDLKTVGLDPLSPAAPYTHVPTMEALRSGALHIIKLDNLEALLTFPSFHTAAALVFAWATWAIPFVRWPSLLVNAVMIAATPVDGAHYFVDVIGGSAVALIAVSLGAYLLGPRRRRARSSMPVENPGTMASA
ncbi:MAG: phosphatase PAP2 family protein [Xanthobacteraceae bacterium]|jgi:membrane-associated phospholipid phosphatase